MPNGHKIFLRGEAGLNEPDSLPGDVVFVVTQTADEAIKRQGNDLLMMKFPISLKQALCDSEIHVRHLDGRVLLVKREPGVPIAMNSWACIPDEGMPHMGRPFMKGNLYICFDVQMPDFLDDATRAALAKLLTSSDDSELMDTDDAEDVGMTLIGDSDAMNGELQARMRAYKSQASAAYDSDEDDEDGRGAQRVQCAQQ